MDGPATDNAPHFAMVRQITAEVEHIPRAALEAWQETGPLRVRRELAARMRHLADLGLLRVEDPERTALHYVALVASEISNRDAVAMPLAEGEAEEIVVAGVRAFLHGYLP